jgi:hypothetical protein
MSSFFPSFAPRTPEKSIANTTHQSKWSISSRILGAKDPKELVANTKYLACHYLAQSALFKDGKLFAYQVPFSIHTPFPPHSQVLSFLPDQKTS